MNREYTLYFAWTPIGTPWDVSLARFDENIFNLLIEHDEGQIPTAVIEIKNPRRGLIDPHLMAWAWISYSVDECGPFPLFYGRLIGIPEKMLLNTVRIKFIARADNYVQQKQQIAEGLKIAPHYDYIWVDDLKRDDPDTILEGWSALYHVDRVTLKVLASDILLGEDGTVDFADEEVFYDSFDIQTLQSPLVAVNVKAEVNWNQQVGGSIALGSWAFPTLGGEPFVGAWPQSGQALGGGWYVGIAWAGERDPDPASLALMTAAPQVTSYTYQWVNTMKTHQTGDTMSVSINYTPPWGTEIVLKQSSQMGIINPYNVDAQGNPDPINQPAKASIDWFCYKTFKLGFDGKQSLAVLSCAYFADRKRVERIELTVQADVQPMLVDPTVVEDTETITLKSANLSEPQLDLDNWSTVGGGHAVGVGVIIFPDNPLVPGQSSSQICVTSGNTGAEEPIFSNIPGQTTQDGTVVWASLGDTPPPSSAQDWVPAARVGIGTLIVPKPILGVPDFDSALKPGSLTFPKQGLPVAQYTVFTHGNGGPYAAMSQCNRAGILNGPSDDQAPSFIGFTNPSGAFAYICIQGGETSLYYHSWPEAKGAQINDGATWLCVGTAGPALGGGLGMINAASFFPTTRGNMAIENLFSRARAKLRKRARAAQVSFETRFETAAMLSCRMNGKVRNINLPGGEAFGKVIGYKLMVDGDSGVIKGSVLLGCSIGKEQVDLTGTPQASRPPLTDYGVPSYVTEHYVKRGYQRYDPTPPILRDVFIPISALTTTKGVVYATPYGAPILSPGSGGSTGGITGGGGWNGTWGSGNGGINPFGPMHGVPPTVPPEGCVKSQWFLGPFDPGGDEMSYAPPANNPNDDGIHFDGYGNDLVLTSQWHGTPSTLNQNNIQSYQLELDQIVHNAVAQANQTKEVAFPSVGGIGTGTITSSEPPFYDIQVAVQQAVLKGQNQGKALWYELALRPISNGPFNTYYVIPTSPLKIIQTIDLSAPSRF
jgi:hypothetical protein